ncbi:putative ATPase/DNA-binding XRE family transcriptional regulator [Actinoplanes octamycinicus]|uniref:Putative ATPase/DNA-binding XRE family transcriptional regulator n=1 Tax=Actinoplanes octamycinicus TaxID=135948 RepID=A0A7W7GTT1_9ACTN|nr:helix-turn-helix domain-containing protein [Actinoplanes octamycinicus]MBB4738159.1 putative ATPase/DNA-binding XRE family transcriptional regulator [Actinoplanes octamycinicus]
MASDQRSGFGAVLRAHRRRAGLTQEELAGRAAIGVRTVRDLERGRSSRPQRTTVELLAGALRLTGSDREEFLAAARGRPSVVLPPAPLDELIGRDVDIAELVARLAAADGPRGVTLVGVAGVGKTSLAVVVAHRLTDAYPGGVAGVAVADEIAAGELLSSVAAGFGAPGPQELPGHLDGRPALIFVDAVDRAPQAVGEALAGLLEQVPRLRFLATGRQPAGLAQERVWPVVPLATPPVNLEADTLGELMAYPAVGLFLERLSRVRRTRLAPHEIAPLAALVRRLGGLPLAIELAAARGRVLTVPEILERYAGAVAHAEPARPPAVISLRAVVAETYRVLAPAEQRALRLLAVFRHRWSRDLAEVLLDAEQSADADVVHLLDRLVALGLLSVSGDHVVHFRLPSAVRDFAVERAKAEGELEDARKRHAHLSARHVLPGTEAVL